MLEKPGITYTQEQKQKDFENCLSEVFGENEEFLDDLHKKVLSCKGHIRFFMHPLELDSFEPISSGHYSEVWKALDITLKQNEKSALTIILFPERSISEQKKLLMKIFKKTPEELGILFLKTNGGDGNLSLEYWEVFKKYYQLFNIPKKFLNQDVHTGHKMALTFFGMGLLLRYLGITSATCYGGFIGKSIDGDKEIIDRCLGTFVRKMRTISGLKLDISSRVVYKDGIKREDLKDLDSATKETGKAGEGYRKEKNNFF